MKKIVVSLCLMASCLMAYGQRTYRFERADRLFQEGKAFFELRNFPGCSDKLMAFKAISHDRDLIQEADYMLAVVASEQGREDAAAVMERYLSLYPDSRHANEAAFLLGSYYFAHEDYGTAIQWFNTSEIDLLGIDQQEDYAYRLAYSLLQLHDLRTARNYFARIEEVGRKYRVPATYYLAYINYAEDKLKQAEPRFEQLKSEPAYREQSLYYLMQIHYVDERYDRVKSEGKALLSAYPNSRNSAEAYRLLGDVAYREGDEATAIKMLDKYVERADSFVRGDLYILGVCRYNRGDYPEAIQAFAEVVGEEDELMQNACLYLGQCYLQTGDRNRARMSFEQAATLTFDPKVQETAMYNYALLIHETSFSGFGESVTIFEDFLNRFPDSKYADKVSDYLAEVYLTTKNYDAALASIDKIRRPGRKILAAKQNILFRMGVEAFTARRPSEAIRRFDEAITPGVYDADAYSQAYYWRGETYYRQDDFNNAAADYRSYLSNATDRSAEAYPLAYYNLGYCLFKQQRYNDALAEFRRYINLEPRKESVSYADAYNRVGDCLFHARQFEAADENYTRAAALQPSSGDYALYRKGFLLGLQKNYQGKITVMERVVREYPESPHAAAALFEMGRSYVMLEDEDRAAAAFTQLQQKYPLHTLARKAGLQLGLLYFNSNRPEQSIKAYKKVISDYPGSEEARTAVQDLKAVYVDMNDVAGYATYVRSLGDMAARFEVSEQDSLTYFAAEKRFLRGESEAEQSLRNYLRQFPKGAFSARANYYLAQIAYDAKNYEEAKKYYEVVIRSGDTKFGEDALTRKGEIEYMNKDYAAALESFKRLAAIATTAEVRDGARLGVLRCARRTKQSADAVKMADELLKNEKISPEIAAEARFLRMKSYIDLKEDAKAQADLVTLSKDTRTVYGAESKYLLAQRYFDRNEIDKAEKEMLGFIEQGTPHSYWLARGFILLSDVYARKGDKFQARQYLTSLQKNYNGGNKDDVMAMIDKRLAALK